MFGFHSRSVLAALTLALTVGFTLNSPVLRRMLRNTMLGDTPETIAPAYAPCSDDELISAVTLVVSVKDTCGQAKDNLQELAKMYPAGMQVIYAYPAIRGCRHVPVSDIGRRLFENFTVVSTGRNDAPIHGFLKAQALLKTKYAALMHNDAYPLERDFACEMYRALEAHPEYPIAAPQIYEKGSHGFESVYAPHSHHANLHVRPTANRGGYRIDYDLSMDLLTQRRPEDFKEGPQVDFLEDHAFFARADRYHELLDERGSFTMEYMDMILNMRARNTSAWFVPTARCVFDVQIEKLTWEDLPYFVYKRSEQIGHQVRVYLTNKWGVAFPDTGIWNYVRYVYLADVVLEKASLPVVWEDQAAVFYSWFASLGFNRYNGQSLPEFIEEPSRGPVTISRSMQLDEWMTNVLPDRVPPKSAMDILPEQQRKTAGVPDISLSKSHMPIAFRTRSCDASDPSSYALCGLAVQDGETCTCWTYVSEYNLGTTLYIDRLMALLKLPPRAITFAQMKYLSKPIVESDVDFLCKGDQTECSVQVHFSSSAQILQWSWFGKQTKYPVTAVGMGFATALIILFLLPSAVVRVGTFLRQKTQIRKLIGVHCAIGGQVMRS